MARSPAAASSKGLDGALYGTTSGGGTGDNNFGTIFRVTLDGQLTTLHEFTDADGDVPVLGTDAGVGRHLLRHDHQRRQPRADGAVFQFDVNAPSAGSGAARPTPVRGVGKRGTVTITVNRTDGFTGAVSVNYHTEDGGSNPPAKAGTDYTATSGTLTWADGDVLPKTFTVPIIDAGNFDNVYREFYVALTRPTGATSGQPDRVHRPHPGGRPATDDAPGHHQSADGQRRGRAILLLPHHRDQPRHGDGASTPPACRRG